MSCEPWQSPRACPRLAGRRNPVRRCLASAAAKSGRNWMKRRKLAKRALPAVLLLATLLASAPAVHACGLENPSSVNVGLLNLAYPDALHVRTAIWVAQRDGLLAPFDAAAVVDPQSPDFVLRQMAALR